MIPNDFVYYQPENAKEALQVFVDLLSENKNSYYYGGGTEIITMSRTGSIKPDAVIDIKNISECKILSNDGIKLYIGSACTLNEIKESKYFPLLGLCCGRIADHTNQCRITLGGNLCGTIIYKEASLPLLLSDAEIILLGPQGMRIEKFEKIFDRKLKLLKGELILQISIPLFATACEYYHIKKTENEKIDYPLVSVAALIHGGSLRVAVSGLCTYPFRNKQMEDILNDKKLSIGTRLNECLKHIPEKALTDYKGTGKYKLNVFKNILAEILEKTNDSL